MADEQILFRFGADWSEFDRNTKAEFQRVREEAATLAKELKALQREDIRLRGGKAGAVPAESDPRFRRYNEIQKRVDEIAKEPVNQVLARKKELETSIAWNRAQMANVAVAGLDNAVRQQRIQAEQASTYRILAADNAYAEVTTLLATERAKLAALEANEKFASDEYIKATTDAAIARRLLAAKEQEVINRRLLSAGTGPIVPGGTGPRARGVINSEIDAQLTTELAKAQRQVLTNERISKLGKGTTLLDTQIAKLGGGLQGYANALAQGTVAQEVLNATIRATADEERTLDKKWVEAKARSINAEQQRQIAIEQEVRRQRGLTVSTAGPTTFQRLQAFIANRQGGTQLPKSPLEYQNLGQFLTGKALTTAGFAVTGAAFYSVFSGIKQVTTEAKALETQLTLIREQLRQAGSESEFPALRNQILETARATGIAGSQIAFLALQLRGAFSQEIKTKGLSFLNEQLDQSVKIARVTGLELPEITDSITGIAKTFDVNAKQIGDTAVGLQQRFGVLAKETIQFAADVGPAAKAAGLSFEEIAAFGAVFQRASGRSGASGAEALGRILPTIEENAVQVLEIFNELGDNQLTQRIARNINLGNTGQVLLDIIRNYSKFNQVQRQSITLALGGRRESQTLAAIFGSARDLNKELNKIGSKRDVGRLNEQFEALQGTMAQTFAELKQTALQLGVALFESGIAQSLTTIARAATELLQVILQLIAPFTQLMSLLDSQGTGGSLAATALLLGSAYGLKRAVGSRRSDDPAGLATAQPTVLPYGNGMPGGVSPERTGRSIGTRIGATVTQYKTALFRNMDQVLAYSLAGGLTAAGVATNDPGLAGLGFGVGLYAAGNPLLGTITVATSIISGFLAAGQEAQRRTDELTQQYSALTNKQLRGIIAGSNQRSDPFPMPIGRDLVAGIAGKISGDQFVQGPTDAQAAVDEINRRNAEKQLRLLQAYSDQDLVSSREKSVRSAIRKAKAAIESNDDGDAVEITTRELNDLYRAYRKGVDENVTIIYHSADVLKSRAASGRFKKNDSQKLIRTIEESGQAFEAGVISFAEYRTALENARDTALLAINASEGGKIPEGVVAALNNTLTRLSKLTSDAIKARVDLLLKIRRYQGQSIGIEDINILSGALGNPELTDPSARIDVLNSIFDALREELQNRIDTAKTAAEKLAIENAGIEVPEAAQIEVVAEQVQQALNSSAQGRAQIVALTATLGQSGLNDLYNAIAAEIVANGGTVRAAMEKVININIAALENTLNLLLIAQGLEAFASAEFAATYAKITQLREALGNLADDPSLDITPVQIQTVHLGNSAQLADQAANEAERAAEEARRLQEEINQARLRLVEAQIEFTKSLTIDPVELAKIDLHLADVHAFLAGLAIASAENEADALNAQADAILAAAERVRAERALQEAMFAIVAAQRDLVLAMVEATGDAVAVAREELTNARGALYVAGLRGAGEAEMTQLRADIVRRETALRDAQLQEKLDTINFNLEVEKISKQQAITQLEALLSSAELLHLTEQQKRDLILQIRRLRGDLQQDLQFNLPSDLRLPTLYEVRRLNQSGGNYQDNRTVNITLNATGGLDAQAAVSKIVDEINAPSVYGSYNRRY